MKLENVEQAAILKHAIEDLDNIMAVGSSPNVDQCIICLGADDGDGGTLSDVEATIPLDEIFHYFPTIKHALIQRLKDLGVEWPEAH